MIDNDEATLKIKVSRQDHRPTVDRVNRSSRGRGKIKAQVPALHRAIKCSFGTERIRHLGRHRCLERPAPQAIRALGGQHSLLHALVGRNLLQLIGVGLGKFLGYVRRNFWVMRVRNLDLLGD